MTVASLIGVTYVQHKRRYQAQIYYEKKNIYIGYFKTPSEAALAYDLKYKELFGTKHERKTNG